MFSHKIKEKTVLSSLVSKSIKKNPEISLKHVGQGQYHALYHSKHVILNPLALIDVEQDDQRRRKLELDPAYRRYLEMSAEFSEYNPEIPDQAREIMSRVLFYLTTNEIDILSSDLLAKKPSIDEQFPKTLIFILPRSDMTNRYVVRIERRDERIYVDKKKDQIHLRDVVKRIEVTNNNKAHEAGLAGRIYFYDVISDENWEFFVDASLQDYVSGKPLGSFDNETLSDLYKEYFEEPSKLRYKAYKSLADALDRLHKLGIQHGDLNPLNIILREDGIKFIDFTYRSYFNIDCETEVSKIFEAKNLSIEEKKALGYFFDVFSFLFYYQYASQDVSLYILDQTIDPKYAKFYEGASVYPIFVLLNTYKSRYSTLVVKSKYLGIFYRQIDISIMRTGEGKEILEVDYLEKLSDPQKKVFFKKIIQGFYYEANKRELSSNIKTFFQDFIQNEYQPVWWHIVIFFWLHAF